MVDFFMTFSFKGLNSLIGCFYSFPVIIFAQHSLYVSQHYSIKAPDKSGKNLTAMYIYIILFFEYQTS